MRQKNKKNNKRIRDKRKSTSIKLTILLIVVGAVLFSAAFFWKANLEEGDTNPFPELVAAVGIELIVSSIVVIVTFYVLNDEESELSQRINKLNDTVYTALINIDKVPLLFLNLMNSCVQKQCCTLQVSDYILQSEELSSDDRSAEMHIVTNELKSYDFTAIASLAIAENIKKDIKYIYYLPGGANDVNSELLKTHVLSFLKKDNTSRRKMNDWICRYVYVKNPDLIGIRNSIHNTTYKDIIIYFLKPNDIDINKLPDYFSTARLSVSTREITNWLIGENHIDVKSREVTKLVNEVKKIYSTIKETTGKDYIPPNNDNKYHRFFQMLISTYDFSQSFVYGDDSAYEMVNGIPSWSKYYTEFFEKYILSQMEKPEQMDPIINWVEESHQQLLASGKTIKNSILKTFQGYIENNILFIDISKAPIKPCYSFCLYVKDDAVNYAWYVCHPHPAQHETVDNPITIHAPKIIEIDNSLKVDFIEAYKWLIRLADSNNVLNEKNSQILKLIENESK